MGNASVSTVDGGVASVITFCASFITQSRQTAPFRFKTFGALRLHLNDVYLQLYGEHFNSECCYSRPLTVNAITSIVTN